MPAMPTVAETGTLTAKRLAGPAKLWARVYPILRALLIALVAYYVALIAVYRFVDPPGSNPILAHYVAHGRVAHSWVPLEKVSRHAVRAVVMAEDARFCRHWGVDWGEMHAAIMRADHRGPRGASTIAMQTAKNVFLWSSRNYIRKAIEIPMAMTMDIVWPKKRMLEIYLNVAHWGPGVFGIEAAARHHFKTSAAKLTRHQAALLAAALPNPLVRRAGRPGPRNVAQCGHYPQTYGRG